MLEAISVGNTISGDIGNDTLNGTDYDDKLYGYGGSDWLYGNKGNDVLSGGDEDDFLFGGGGKDMLIGDGGNDFFLGGSGNDTMGGSSGNDIMYGNSGRDTLLGGGDDDKLYGSDSTSKGAYEVDKLRGDGGADLFVLGTVLGGGGAWYTANRGADYALIQDFDRMEGDKIQLYGSIGDYDTFTGNWFGTSSTDTAITYKGEVIGVLQDVSGGRFMMNSDPNFVV